MNFVRKHIMLSIILVVFSFYVYDNFTRIVSGNKLVDKNSKYYINNLYMSEQRVYNEFLDDRQKRMYDLLLTATVEGKSDITIKLMDFGCKDANDCVSLVWMANDAIIVDHPELLNYGWYDVDYSNGIFKIVIKQALTFPFLENIGEARIERIIDDIKVETKNMSDKEKIKYVYNWMGNNTSYDKMFTEFSKNQSIYSVFMSKEAVCAGFAKASQVIFQNIGINSFGITGNTSGPHMWNVVEYDGKYYFFDSTVATSLDKSSKYYEDGLKQEQMADYVMDHPEWYPTIEKVGIKW